MAIRSILAALRRGQITQEQASEMINQICQQQNDAELVAIGQETKRIKKITKK